MSSSEGAAADASLVATEVVGPVLKVTVNRPAKRNALNDATIFALDRVFATLGSDIRCVVLTGEGANFSAGLDLSELKDRDTFEGILHSMSWTPVLERIQFGRVPVVAALKGAVIGGGLELALATHVRVAEASSYYALPEGQRGIYVGGGASVRLPRVIGVDRMMDMMLTGRTYSAAEGLALGLSQYVVESGHGLTRAMDIAAKIASNAPMTNFALIQALPRIAESDRQSGFFMESLVAGIAQAAPDAKARLREFLEGRAPKTKPTSDV